jgi:hypothetical protein
MLNPDALPCAVFAVPADIWRAGADGGVLAAALARAPSAHAAAGGPLTAAAAAAASAAKVTARFSDLGAQLERFNKLLDNPSLSLPDGGANVRAGVCHACDCAPCAVAFLTSLCFCDAATAARKA